MMERMQGAIFWVLLSAATLTGATKVHYAVECTSREMLVKVDAAGVDNVELEKWGELPGCAPTFQGSYYQLALPLDDELACGTTSVKNKLTGETVFYHKVAVTSNLRRNVLLVKCRLAADNSTLDNIVKRDLPPEFEEPDYIEITSEVTGTAPIPILGVGVKQDGNLIGGEINVRPGTPLTMEVYLDNASAGTYGILMSYMEVTDRGSKRETMIFNGCSVDPILFDNFVTNDGDLVAAKFRAFKFPETNYVLFRGTVDVCLDKCQGIACSNGQLGFGRRRRGVDSQPADPNKIFEVKMMTYLKIDENINATEESSLITEDFATMAEDMAKDLSKAMSKSMSAVETAVVEEHDTLTWNSQDDFIPMRSKPNSEPSFIYFNNGQKLANALYMTVFAFLLCLYQ